RRDPPHGRDPSVDGRSRRAVTRRGSELVACNGALTAYSQRSERIGAASDLVVLAGRPGVNFLHDEHLGELAVLLADQHRRERELALLRPVEEALDHVGLAVLTV